MSYQLVIEIDGLPKSTMNANRSWRGRLGEAQKWKNKVLAEIDFKKKPKIPLKLARVILTRFAAGAKHPDADNLRSTFKHVLDGLVEADILSDDSYDVIGEPVVKWIKSKPGKGKIRIEVYEVQGPIGS